jgi:hypothetical protein
MGTNVYDFKEPRFGGDYYLVDNRPDRPSVDLMRDPGKRIAALSPNEAPAVVVETRKILDELLAAKAGQQEMF